MRLAKIVSTLGPATSNPDMIRQLLLAGVNIFRLNFSHAQHEKLAETIRWIREISRELNLPTAILGDLQGPKFRIGELEDHRPVMLEQGQTVRFAVGTHPGNQGLLTTATPQIIEELKVGDEVLLNDGLIVLNVLERLSQHEIICSVVVGGLLGQKKGINVPGIKMANLSAMTEKDKVDAVFALQQDLDYIALSFVRSYQDILYLRRFLEENMPEGQTTPLIIAKIEKPQALDEIDAIIATADGIMVARGDLGVELRPERVPVIQKMLIQKANHAEKPVITATQMLETMIQQSSPTRAEVSDVANAVFDGSDALMLSGETAVGKYPVETVRMMARIIQETESHYMEWNHHVETQDMVAEATSDRVLKFHEAIAQSACHAARKANTKAIVVLSSSGRMARRISKRKPQRAIIALTPNSKVYRLLNLLWGVYPLKMAQTESTDETFCAAEEAIINSGLLHKRDPIVFCAGQTHISGISNTIKIYPLGDVLEQCQLSGAAAGQMTAAAGAGQKAPQEV